jgi:hypothetical protein
MKGSHAKVVGHNFKPIYAGTLILFDRPELFKTGLKEGVSKIMMSTRHPGCGQHLASTRYIGLEPGADPGFGHRGGEGRKRQRSHIKYDAHICDMSSHGNCISLLQQRSISTSVLRKLLKQNIFDSCNLDLFYHIFSAQGLTVEAMGLKKAIYMFYSFSSIFPRRRIAKLT